MPKIICVYSSSSQKLDKSYYELAYSLGEKIADRNDKLIFGGGMTGLMGETAKGVHKNRGYVIGVIPEALNVEGVVYALCDELFVTKTMRERKAIMDEKADAFIALPGGFGTFEELLEIITLKQLKYHNKPIVIINLNNYYNRLIEQFDFSIEQGFAKEECKKLYYVANSIEDALNHIDNYVPFETSSKWLTDV